MAEDLDEAGNRRATSLLPSLPDMPAGEDCIKQTSDLSGETPQEYVVVQVEQNVQKAAKYGFQVRGLTDWEHHPLASSASSAQPPASPLSFSLWIGLVALRGAPAALQLAHACEKS